jgi:hypothetical protein
MAGSGSELATELYQTCLNTTRSALRTRFSRQAAEAACLALMCQLERLQTAGPDGVCEGAAAFLALSRLASIFCKPVFSALVTRVNVENFLQATSCPPGQGSSLQWLALVARSFYEHSDLLPILEVVPDRGMAWVRSLVKLASHIATEAEEHGCLTAAGAVTLQIPCWLLASLARSSPMHCGMVLALASDLRGPLEAAAGLHRAPGLGTRPGVRSSGGACLFSQSDDPGLDTEAWLSLVARSLAGRDGGGASGNTGAAAQRDCDSDSRLRATRAPVAASQWAISEAKEVLSQRLASGRPVARSQPRLAHSDCEGNAPSGPPHSASSTCSPPSAATAVAQRCAASADLVDVHGARLLANSSCGGEEHRAAFSAPQHAALSPRHSRLHHAWSPDLQRSDASLDRSGRCDEEQEWEAGDLVLEESCGQRVPSSLPRQDDAGDGADGLTHSFRCERQLQAASEHGIGCTTAGVPRGGPSVQQSHISKPRAAGRSGLRREATSDMYAAPGSEAFAMSCENAQWLIAEPPLLRDLSHAARAYDTPGGPGPEDASTWRLTDGSASGLTYSAAFTSQQLTESSKGMLAVRSAVPASARGFAHIHAPVEHASKGRGVGQSLAGSDLEGGASDLECTCAAERSFAAAVGQTPGCSQGCPCRPRMRASAATGASAALGSASRGPLGTSLGSSGDHLASPNGNAGSSAQSGRSSTAGSAVTLGHASRAAIAASAQRRQRDLRRAKRRLVSSLVSSQSTSDSDRSSHTCGLFKSRGRRDRQPADHTWRRRADAASSLAGSFASRDFAQVTGAWHADADAPASGTFVEACGSPPTTPPPSAAASRWGPVLTGKSGRSAGSMAAQHPLQSARAPNRDQGDDFEGVGGHRAVARSAARRGALLELLLSPVPPATPRGPLHEQPATSAAVVPSAARPPPRGAEPPRSALKGGRAAQLSVAAALHRSVRFQRCAAAVPLFPGRAGLPESEQGPLFAASASPIECAASAPTPDRGLRSHRSFVAASLADGSPALDLTSPPPQRRRLGTAAKPPVPPGSARSHSCGLVGALGRSGRCERAASPLQLPASRGAVCPFDAGIPANPCEARQRRLFLDTPTSTPPGSPTPAAHAVARATSPLVLNAASTAWVGSASPEPPPPSAACLAWAGGADATIPPSCATSDERQTEGPPSCEAWPTQQPPHDEDGTFDAPPSLHAAALMPPALSLPPQIPVSSAAATTSAELPWLGRVAARQQRDTAPSAAETSAGAPHCRPRFLQPRVAASSAADPRPQPRIPDGGSTSARSGDGITELSLSTVVALPVRAPVKLGMPSQQPYHCAAASQKLPMHGGRLTAAAAPSACPIVRAAPRQVARVVAEPSEARHASGLLAGGRLPLRVSGSSNALRSAGPSAATSGPSRRLGAQRRRGFASPPEGWKLCGGCGEEEEEEEVQGGIGSLFGSSRLQCDVPATATAGGDGCAASPLRGSATMDDGEAEAAGEQASHGRSDAVAAVAEWGHAAENRLPVAEVQPRRAATLALAVSAAAAKGYRPLTLAAPSSAAPRHSVAAAIGSGNGPLDSWLHAKGGNGGAGGTDSLLVTMPGAAARVPGAKAARGHR